MNAERELSRALVRPRASARSAAAILTHIEFAVPACETKVSTSAHNPSNEAVTSKLVDPSPMLPALSVAVAEKLLVPSPNLYAAPETSARVSLATPDVVSSSGEVIVT